ncbi:MAG: hypothetical protein QOK31_461, partial [Solirubrobacteraceae bacterium]|nr:hypothetical protein [Solirubrobacteraceae bacterium]
MRNFLALADYQVPEAGQPPLDTGAQVRVTVP